MTRLSSGVFALLALALAACAPSIVTPTPAVTPTPVIASPGGAGVPLAPASTAPASAMPSGAPVATPTPVGSFRLPPGNLLRRYEFKGIGGLAYDLNRDLIYVIDGVNDDRTPRRYLLRRFKRDGTFEAAVDLHRTGEKAPDAVDGFGFDLAGTPLYTYREDERFSLRRIFTATLLDATDVPTNSVERAGLAALRVEGKVVTMGVLKLDPEEKPLKTANKREIFYSRAELEGEPLVLGRIPDPFAPTSFLVMGQGGELFLFGPMLNQRPGIKRLGPDQKPVDLTFPYPVLPDHVWMAPDNHLWLGYDTSGKTAARIRRMTVDGQPAGEAEVTLADGRKVFALDALTFDAKGVPLIAGRAIDAELKTISGIFSFE